MQLDYDRESGGDVGARAAGIEVVSCPMPPSEIEDFIRVPTHAQLVCAVDSIRDALAHGLRVFMHCLHGRDRTSLIWALARVRILGWSRVAAENEMAAFGFKRERTPALWRAWEREMGDDSRRGAP